MVRRAPSSTSQGVGDAQGPAAGILVTLLVSNDVAPI